MLALGSDHTGALTVTGEVATTREVADMLGSWFLDAELVLQPGTSDLVAEFDPTEAVARIGYEPTTSLRRGLLLTANAARERAGLALVAR
jgi:nucleoside-diphosphate-sugar epimerase